MDKVIELYDNANVHLMRWNPGGARNTIRNSGEQSMSVVAEIAIIICAIAVFISVIGFVFNKQGDNDIKAWVIGIAISVICLLLAIGWRLWLT